MALRDRYRGLVWLKSLKTDPPRGETLVVGSVTGTMHSLISTLTGTFGLWVEVDQDRDQFTLRCYPRRRSGRPEDPNFCASYRGPSLPRLLTCAVADYSEAMADPKAMQLGPLEAVRWVA